MRNSSSLVFRRFEWCLGLMILLLNSGCSESEDDPPVKYSFFVAGHAYGSPENYQGGLYDPFVEDINYINGNHNMRHGIFTGDIVKHPSQQYWDSLDKDLTKIKIGCDLHLAPGNHDGEKVLTTERYMHTGDDFWWEEDDLFLVFDVNENGWNISKGQMEFLQYGLNSKRGGQENEPANIFVFTHQLVWRDREGYDKIGINSYEGMSDTLTFWDEIAPVFREMPSRVHFFAGDVGAFDWSTPIFHDTQDNMSFIASGMGGGIKDNYIIVDVLENNEVRYRLISLDKSKDLGPLEDY